MKKLVETLRIIGFIAVAICFLYPPLYNLMNPDITQMRLLLMFWWLYVLGFGLFLLCLYKWE